MTVTAWCLQELAQTPDSYCLSNIVTYVKQCGTAKSAADIALAFTPSTIAVITAPIAVITAPIVIPCSQKITLNFSRKGISLS